MTKLLEVNDVHVQFSIPKPGLTLEKNIIKAVRGISFDLESSQIIGIVGESGCGKSTLLKAVLGLEELHKGSVKWFGKDITEMSKKELSDMRRNIQVIFQDPLACLNPRMKIFNIIAEPLKVYEPNLSKEEVYKKVLEVVEKVGLTPSVLSRYPHEFSGGQCQRINIARAIIVKPKILVCDEAVSALDVSIKSQIINLLCKLSEEMDVSLLFISHDLAIVRYISHKIIVMYLGIMVEFANADMIYEDPYHPYTHALINSAPLTDPEKESVRSHKMLQGEIPSPFNIPSGCVFHTRCIHATDECRANIPKLETPTGTQNKVACFHYKNINHS